MTAISENEVLFEAEMYCGTVKSDFKKIEIQASVLKRTTDKDAALIGDYYSDLIFSLEGENDHFRDVYGQGKFHCINTIMGHCREWVRSILEDIPNSKLYLKIDGGFRELPLDIIFGTNDCITWEIEHKIEFAMENGYRENWDSVEVIEPVISKSYKLELQSDFGQIQVFDSEFDSLEPPEWTEKAHQNFACYKKGALFLRVMENDDHIIPFELLEGEPDEDHKKFVHIVDSPFKTKGSFEIAEQPINVHAGMYNFRWYCSNTKKGVWKYQLKIWPSKSRKVTVLKRYVEEN